MKMECVNNSGYSSCLTIGKVYDVEVELMPRSGRNMFHVVDDNGEPLQTMVERFVPVKE